MAKELKSNMGSWQARGIRLAGIVYDEKWVVDNSLPLIKNKRMQAEILRCMREGVEPSAEAKDAMRAAIATLIMRTRK